MRRRAWIGLLLVILTGAAHLVFENVWHLKGPYIAVAGTFWLVYIIRRLRTPGQARAWGMRSDTFRPSIIANALVFIAGSGTMIAYGISQGRSIPSVGFFYLLALYPIWGFIQQFLLCSLVGQNLQAITGRALVSVLAGTVLFGIVHAPDWTLVGLTAVAGVFWISFHLRWPNLWVQGIAHGWLGAVAYFYVLGRDPWIELLQSLDRLR
jgi:hypothetical protein